MGVIVAIATGRASDSVFEYVRQLNLPQATVPLIVFNGSVCLLYDNSTGSVPVRELFQRPIQEEAARKLVALADEKGLVIQLYNGKTGEVFAKPVTELHNELLLRYENLVERRQTIIDDIEIAYKNCENQFAKALVLTYQTDEFMAAAREQLPPGILHMIRGSPEPFFVEFLRPQVNKGTALESLCRELGVDLSQTIAFGDGENDVEMLETAGRGVAMANGRDKAKLAAKQITEYSNDDDGVARHLEQMIDEGFF